MKYLTLFFALIFSTLQAQQRFYYFAVNEKYGIVDAEAKEILAPKYLWADYSVPEEAGAFILRDHGSTALLVDEISGKQEAFENLSSTIYIDGKTYVYGILGNQPLLINLENPNEREALGKKYASLDRHDKTGILLAYLPDKTVDILDPKTRRVIRENIAGEYVVPFKIDNGYIFAVKKAKSYYFLDNKYRVIPKLQVKEGESLEKYLQSKNYKVESNMVTAIAVYTPPKYPRLSYLEWPRKFPSDFTLTFIDLNKEESPILVIKNLSKSLDPSREELKVSQTNDAHHVEFLFFVNAATKKVLFPKKYWSRYNFQEPAKPLTLNNEQQKTINEKS